MNLSRARADLEAAFVPREPDDWPCQTTAGEAVVPPNVPGYPGFWCDQTGRGLREPGAPGAVISAPRPSRGPA
jgi:hypothetical protein